MIKRDFMIQLLLFQSCWHIVAAKVSSKKEKSFRENFAFFRIFSHLFACELNISLFFAKFRFNLFCEKMRNFRETIFPFCWKPCLKFKFEELVRIIMVRWQFLKSTQVVLYFPSVTLLPLPGQSFDNFSTYCYSVLKYCLIIEQWTMSISNYIIKGTVGVISIYLLDSLLFIHNYRRYKWFRSE